MTSSRKNLIGGFVGEEGWSTTCIICSTLGTIVHSCSYFLKEVSLNTRWHHTSDEALLISYCFNSEDQETAYCSNLQIPSKALIMLRQGNIFTSICHSVHRMDWGRHPLPRQTGGMYPSIHWDRHPQETPFWQTTPLWADTPGQTPPGRYLPGRHPLADTPLSRHPQAVTPGQTPP